MNSSSTYKTNKQRWQDEPGEALSNVQSEMNLAIDQINVLNAKPKVLNDVVFTSQSDESYAGGSLSMKNLVLGKADRTPPVCLEKYLVMIVVVRANTQK